MSLADAIAASASAPAATSSAASSVNRKFTGKSPASAAVTAAGSAAGSNDRPRINSPAYQVYEDKKNACEARIADIRARIVSKLHYYLISSAVL